MVAGITKDEMIFLGSFQFYFFYYFFFNSVTTTFIPLFILL